MAIMFFRYIFCYHLHRLQFSYHEKSSFSASDVKDFNSGIFLFSNPCNKLNNRSWALLVKLIFEGFWYTELQSCISRKELIISSNLIVNSNSLFQRSVINFFVTYENPPAYISTSLGIQMALKMSPNVMTLYLYKVINISLFLTKYKEIQKLSKPVKLLVFHVSYKTGSHFVVILSLIMFLKKKIKIFIKSKKKNIFFLMGGSSHGYNWCLKQFDWSQATLGSRMTCINSKKS